MYWCDRLCILLNGKKWKVFYLNIWAYLTPEQYILLGAFLIVSRNKLRYFIQFSFKTAIKYWGIIIINKVFNSYILWFYSTLEINALLIFLSFSLCSLIIVMIIIIILRFTLSSFAEDRGTMTYPQLSYLLWSPLASNWASVFHPLII